MKNIFTGQAYSYSGLQRPHEIKAGLPATLSLALGAGIIWLLTSIAVGTLAGVKAGRYTDRVLTVLSMIGVSMPPFFFGAVLIYFLGYKANIIPARRLRAADHRTRVQWLVHLILPWFTLSVLFVGFYSRVLRSTILDTINEDYVRTARAKGLSERQVLVRHILRNSLIPIISLWGLDLAQVIGGGAILTETVYNLHGVGQLARDSIGRLDIITLMAIVMLTAFAVVHPGRGRRHPLRLPRSPHPAARERRGRTAAGGRRPQGLVRHRGRHRARRRRRLVLGRPAARWWRSSASRARASR